MQTTSVQKLKYKLGFDSISCVDGLGKGDGLALLWKTQVILEIQNFPMRHIKSWEGRMLACFYGLWTPGGGEKNGRVKYAQMSQSTEIKYVVMYW